MEFESFEQALEVCMTAEDGSPAQEAAMRASADRWNGLYSSHARRKAER